MDIHKPKPWHGLREFLKEYLIIVIGVLTALGAEQFVSYLDWQTKLREAREGLSGEVAEVLGKAEVRVRLAPCINQRLDTMAVIVDEAARTGKLPALPKPVGPPYNSWSSGVWQSALSAQTASHMPADRLRSYTRFYTIISRIDAAGPEEEAVWTTLFGLAGPGRTFGVADAQTFRAAIGQARTFNGLAAGFGVRAHQLVDVHHLPYDTGDYRRRVDAVPTGLAGCATFEGKPPANYGASPVSDFPDFARRNPTR